MDLLPMNRVRDELNKVDDFRKNVKSPQVFINCKFNWFVQEEINMELSMRLHEVREKAVVNEISFLEEKNQI